jgi:addiction module RelE/StbE family toxin
MPIVYFSLAIQDLLEIRAYIAQNNPDAAQQVANRLKQMIQRLATMPNLGKPGRVSGTQELVTPKIGRTTYIIVYRIKNDRVEILRVL